ncbi:MAG: outer membrane protein transport protein [Ignavibacteriales bacterium]|nr:outer membrane protein transport protein [Ignavibacteriales bacterium]
MCKKLFSIVTVFVLALIMIQSASATDGYFRHGYGIKYSALAGSGVAISLSSLGAINNPALLTYVDSRLDINVSLFSPSREYTITGAPSGFPGTFGLTPGTIESESNFFIFPTIGIAYKINPTMSLGLAFYGNGGMNSDYPAQTFYDPTSPSTGVNIEQMFAAATYSIEIAKGHSLGVSALLGWQRFAAKGLIAFSNFSSDPASLTGNSFSTAFGYGGKIGYVGKFTDFLSFGAAYQTKLSMQKFERYQGLFAEKGDFDVPASWTAGVAIVPMENLTVLLDVQQILYSGIKSVGNPMDLVNNSPALPNGDPNPNFKSLGNAEGWGFGWEDVTAVKFGLMYKLDETWTILGGYSFNSQPIPESEVMFNILAPAVVQHHITLGLSKLIGSNEINFAMMYAPAVTVEGPNPMEAPGAQTIGIKMSQFQIDFGYAFTF